MKRDHRQKTVWALLALLVVAVPVLADGDRAAVSAGPMDLATVKVNSDGVDLAPKVRYERAILTVSGMGVIFSREFDKSTAPRIEPFAPEGGLLADGIYNWELQLVPDATAASKLRASASANGGVAERPWLPKTGTFAIRGGAIATPNAVRERDESAERTAASQSGSRRDVAPRGYAGQVFGSEKSDRAAPDGDDSGIGEAAMLKATAAAEKARGRTAEADPRAQTGPDSDRQAVETGGSLEKALVAVPKAHETVQPTTRPRSDGSNGRPRSDR